MLATPEERFRATKPVYEAMVAAGFLRKCIPVPAGGDNAGLIDMAIMTEEFYSVNASITLTMLGTVLGLLPILLGGTPEQAGRLLKPFLKKPESANNNSTKKNVDVGQQPQRRPAGRCRSVCVRARWNRRRLARAREGSDPS